MVFGLHSRIWSPSGERPSRPPCLICRIRRTGSVYAILGPTWLINGRPSGDGSWREPRPERKSVMVRGANQDEKAMRFWFEAGAKTGGQWGDGRGANQDQNANR